MTPVNFFIIGSIGYSMLFPIGNYVLSKFSNTNNDNTEIDDMTEYEKCEQNLDDEMTGVLLTLYKRKSKRKRKKYSEWDKGRRCYILSNILKSSVLSFLSFYFFMAVYYGDLDLIHTERWGSNQRVLKNLIGLYAITDTVPLIINREKMMMSTVIHHTCVFITYVYIAMSDLGKEGIFKSVITYGGFSSIAYLVNFYLGSRFIIDNNNHINYLKKISGVSYIASCGFNWTWQIYYLIKLLNYYYINGLYLGYFKIVFLNIMIINWIKDDLVLIKHLIT